MRHNARTNWARQAPRRPSLGRLRRQGGAFGPCSGGHWTDGGGGCLDGVTEGRGASGRSHLGSDALARHGIRSMWVASPLPSCRSRSWSSWPVGMGRWRSPSPCSLAPTCDDHGGRVPLALFGSRGYAEMLGILATLYLLFRISYTAFSDRRGLRLCHRRVGPVRWRPHLATGNGADGAWLATMSQRRLRERTAAALNSYRCRCRKVTPGGKAACACLRPSPACRPPRHGRSGCGSTRWRPRRDPPAR